MGRLICEQSLSRQKLETSFYYSGELEYKVMGRTHVHVPACRGLLVTSPLPVSHRLFRSSTLRQQPGKCAVEPLLGRNGNQTFFSAHVTGSRGNSDLVVLCGPRGFANVSLACSQR